MTHPTDEELEAMAARLEDSAYFRSPAHEVEAAAMLRACKGVTVPDALDPDMPAQAIKLHMGEMSAAEQRTARAAIRWANSRRSPAPDVRELEWRDSYGVWRAETPFGDYMVTGKIVKMPLTSRAEMVCEDTEAAKAAAQADYRARILSALATQEDPDEG